MESVVTRVGFTPLKGTRHSEQPRAEVDETGIAGDRVFALVDPERARVVRTAETPSLMAVRSSWDGETLRVTLPDGQELAERPRDTGEVVEADYWGRRRELRWQHSELIAPALSHLVGNEVGLVRAEPGDVVWGGAVSIITSAELDELADRLGATVDPRAFRATVTLDLDRQLLPGEVWAIGSAVVEISGDIPRCAVINANPSDGTKAADVLGALAGYRKVGNEIYFGADAFVRTAGSICAGDVAELLA